jgi:DNA-binding FadR family transcriptional regulator
MTELLSSGFYQRNRISAADQVFNDLRRQILSGHLERGERLPSEKELAVHYEVSPPTVREAVRALSSVGLVEARHGAGTFVIAESGAILAAAMNSVVELENIDLLSIFDLSEAVYLKVVGLAMTKASDKEIAALQAAADRFKPTTNNVEFPAALRAFLMGLVATSHNRLIITLSTFLVEAQISLATGVARRSPTAWKRVAGQLIGERQAIVDALRERDREAAEEAVRSYMKRGGELVRKYVKPQDA